ncbi:MULTISPECIES: rod-binding protein [unclassified Devosia]|uniref:rod-binding protein n=1 Tax=unclassified Devosia TaxID=196773 RepID=UPI00145F877E|nr:MULTISPECIES: rod-binding protein [unclassified Devosia]MBJ6986519.1 rod-binding protein [Devosia sp. MC521]MBK1793660.1 rod-binding protein [Devosia sp. WQ 349K1]QMW61565.1 rod-binding protein [Devosia sp. MC521]
MDAITNSTLKQSPQYAAFRQQAEELEGVFLTQLTKAMFETVQSDEGMGGGSFGEDTWRGMQAEEFANAIAQNGGIGLADQIVAQLLSQQEANSNPINIVSGIGAYQK